MKVVSSSGLGGGGVKVYSGESKEGVLVDALTGVGGGRNCSFTTFLIKAYIIVDYQLNVSYYCLVYCI